MTRAALYARFSTERQTDASIQGQFRNCEAYCEREGWTIVDRYGDEAISGRKTDRPGYQRMLADAEAGRFDVLVVDDLSRLSRDEIETKLTVRRFQFRGLRIVGISDGYDSAAKGAKVHAGVRGLINDIYIDDLREKTHRGLAGKALQGFNTGGRCYGYRHLPIEDPSKLDEHVYALFRPRSEDVLRRRLNLMRGNRYLCRLPQQRERPSRRFQVRPREASPLLAQKQGLIHRRAGRIPELAGRTR